MRQRQREHRDREIDRQRDGDSEQDTETESCGDVPDIGTTGKSRHADAHTHRSRHAEALRTQGVATASLCAR